MVKLRSAEKKILVYSLLSWAETIRDSYLGIPSVFYLKKPKQTKPPNLLILFYLVLLVDRNPKSEESNEEEDNSK